MKTSGSMKLLCVVVALVSSRAVWELDEAVLTPTSDRTVMAEEQAFNRSPITRVGRRDLPL